MNRKTLVSIHMYLSAFFAPALFLVAISGGLYLIGIKGTVTQEVIYSSDNYEFDQHSDNLKAEVDQLLNASGVVDFQYEYVKSKGNMLYTRPTSKHHYMIKLDSNVELISAKPSLQNAMIELHKGHGPMAFKNFQKFFAAGLVLIVATGLWLGLSSSHLLRRTLATSAAGTVCFLGLLLL